MENFMSDGNSKKRRQEMLDAEMAEIKRKLNPTAVEVEDEDEEDDDDFVLPTKENPRTIFVNARENPIVFEDEDVIDDDDDDIDLVDNTTLDEDDDDDEIIDDPNLESSVAITVNNWTDAGIPSINVTVNGDFDKAWEKDGLPLTVTINKDTSVALSVQDLYKILKPTVDEIIDDMQ